MPSVETQLAQHGAQIAALQENEKDTSRKLDWLIRLIITTLVAAVGGLVVQLAKH